MVSILAFALLPATVATSCVEGPSGCATISGQTLLQSSSKNGIEVANQGGSADLLFQNIRSLGSLGQSSKAPSDSLQLLGQLETRAEEVVLGGRPLTESEKSLFKTVNETLENTTLPALTKGHTYDQATMNRVVKALESCNEDLDTDSGGALRAKQAVDAKGKAHRFCRGNQSQLKIIYEKRLAALKTYAASLQQPKQPASPDLPALLAYFQTLQKWLNDTDKMYTKKNSEYNAAKSAYENKITDCNTAQQQFESNWCQWIGQATVASKAYTRCWNHSGGVSWNTTKAAAVGSAEQRKIEYVALKKIQCFLGALFLKEPAEAKKHMNGCKALVLNMTVFDLVNTNAPSKSSLAKLGDLQTMPGTSSWAKSVYAGVEGEHKAVPCAEAVNDKNQSIWRKGSVTHLCRDDEHVQLHRCKKCEPGKGGGGNAAGEDTSCSAILCKADQRVVSNACKPCPSGQTNAAGDDASKGNTTCDKAAFENGDAVFLKNVAFKKWVRCAGKPCKAVSTCPDTGSGCKDSGERLQVYNSRDKGPFYNGDVIWLKWSNAGFLEAHASSTKSTCPAKKALRMQTKPDTGCYNGRFRIYNSADSLCKGWACRSYKMSADGQSTEVDFSRKINSGDVVWLQGERDQKWFFCGGRFKNSECYAYRVHNAKSDVTTQFQIQLAN